MADGFIAVHAFLRKRKRPFFAVLFLVVATGGAGLFALPFDTSLLVMLPDTGPVRRAMEFLQEAEFSDKVALSFANDDPHADREKFLARVAGVVGGIDSPWLRPIPLEMTQADALDQFGFFLRQAPSILDETDLARIAKRMEPDALDAIVRGRYLQLLKPEGGFMASAIRRDPLDIHSLIIERMQRVLTTFAYGATLEQGLFVSADGRHAMRVFETPASMTDADDSAALVAELDRILAAIPAGMRVDAVCGHKHTVGNRMAIESDIRRMLLIASLAFVLLFLFCFRDPAALWIFMIPLGSVVLALHAVGWALGTLSTLVVGLGSVVAGIAVDYGIHVFVAVKRGDDPAESARAVAKPVCFGALTTLSVFVAFLFSQVEGYRQLGWFSGTSIVIALGLALFALPLAIRSGDRAPFVSAPSLFASVWRRVRGRIRLVGRSPSHDDAVPRDLACPPVAHGRRRALREREIGVERHVFPLQSQAPAAQGGRGSRQNGNRRGGRRSAVAVRLVYAALMAVALFWARNIEFDSDLKALDGAGEQVLRAESRFREIWTPDGSGQAFLTVTADDYAAVEALNQTLAAEARRRLGDDAVLNWASIWPAPEQRRANAERWTRFWNDHARMNRLQEDLASQGARHGFARDAFVPFFEWVREPTAFAEDPDDNILFDRLRDRFAHRTRFGWHFSTWFPDTEEALRLMAPLAEQRDDVFMVSPSGLGDAFSSMAAREIARIVAVALILMLAAMLLVFRNVKLSLAAALPAATGVLCMLAGMSVLGHPLNVANMIAGIVVVGLCMDYGIFVAYARERGLDSGTGVAVTLSAATTVVGSGTLLFARHPALFSIGLTLTLGVCAGYAAAMLVLPAFYRSAKDPKIPESG